MNPNLVFFLESESRDDTLKELVHLIYTAGKITDEEAFLKAIMQREKLISTGIGMGVAIPHAKLHTYDKFFISICILKKAIDWNSLDGAPVRLVFMIGGPDDKKTEYLQLLSELTHIIKEKEKRKALLSTNDPQAIIELFHT
jgi:nitrogen PTS system EIIA component